MYTLYCRNGAGSQAVEALLAVCGAKTEIAVLDRNPDGSFPEFFHRINPKAEVPTLVLPDHSIMTESAAMMIHIADSHPAAGMSPALDSAQRPQFLRWMVYLAATLYMSDLRLYYPQRYTPRPGDIEGIKEKATESMAREFAILSDAITEGPFFGPKISALDIYAAMLISWAPDMTALFAERPKLKALYDAVTAVPEVKAVWERNGV